MLTIETTKVFEPLVKADGARYLGAWGGRGSGKSWFFAEKLVERALLQPGLRAVCVRDAEFNVTVVPNQGSGAAAMRIEAVRRLFPQFWFNESTTEAGRDALGYYHERKDEQRDTGLGPEH